mgnify:CR=1 FL=1
MERTYILGNSASLKDLGGIFTVIPKLVSDSEIHNWVIELFRCNDIEKVVIEIEDQPLVSLQIGYHIRLSIESLREKALVPILYLSKLSLNTIIVQAEIYSQIIATKGVAFSEFDLPSNKLEIDYLVGLNESEYLTKFLKIIQIQPDETIGRHSLANIWGAYAMDIAANANGLSDDADFKKTLYFKYVSAFNDMDKLKPSKVKHIGNINLGVPNRINAEGRRILLIDDEASKGWEVVLRKIFKTSRVEDFLVLNEKVKDFEAFSDNSKNIIESQKFDLYLVDLRLNGLDEDENLKVSDFSGMKLLKKIKSINQGNQVIIFSASNKVWNLKALMDAGADGYYVKESPEYNFSRSISEQNYFDFKDSVADCFKRDFLRELYTKWERAKNKSTNPDNNFVAESNTALQISWEQIKNGYLDFSFLTLFQSIEVFANNLYLINDYNDTLEGEITIDKQGEENEWLMTFVKDKQNGNYFSFVKSLQESSVKPTTLYKLSCLFKIKYQKDDVFLKKIGTLNKLRNNIAHGIKKNAATKQDLIEILNILAEIRRS